jgi:DUF971 family protein
MKGNALAWLNSTVTRRNSMSAPHPSKIRLSENKKALEITWDDDTVCRYPMALLRKNCPCATCQTDRASKGDFYIPLFTADALALKDVTQLGNYAIQLTWHDGHHTGIYDYQYLHRLCPEHKGSAEAES